MPELPTADRAAPAPLPRRVVQTFLAPSQLFRGFASHTPWIGPLAVSVVVGMLVVLAVPDSEFQIAGQPVDRLGRPVEVTSDPATIARFGRYLAMLSVLATQPIVAFVLAGALMLLFGTLLRGEARFGQYLAITTHAFLITALGALVAAAVALLRGAPPQGVSPGLLLADPSATLAGRILSGIDLFTLWALVFAALGVSMVNRRRSFVSAAALLLGLYLAAVVVVAAVTG